MVPLGRGRRLIGFHPCEDVPERIELARKKKEIRDLGAFRMRPDTLEQIFERMGRGGDWIITHGRRHPFEGVRGAERGLERLPVIAGAFKLAQRFGDAIELLMRLAKIEVPIL